jgi:hypothetical protein
MINNISVPLGGWTVPRPVFKRLQEVAGPVGDVVTLATLKAHLRITDSNADEYLTDVILPGAIDAVQRYTNRRLLPQSVIMWMDFLPGTGNEYTLYGAGTAQIPVRYANIGMFRWFELMGTPVASVDSFHFITNNGVEVVFDPSQYIVDNADRDMPARIVLQRGTVWPVDLQVAHSLRIAYSLGYRNGWTAWLPATSYGLGAQVSNGGLSYQCTTAGTSAASGGPSGTGATITDGTAVWKFVSDSLSVPASLKHAVLLISAALWSNRGDNADQQPDILGFPAVRALLDPYRVLRVSIL